MTIVSSRIPDFLPKVGNTARKDGKIRPKVGQAMNTIWPDELTAGDILL